MCRKHSAYFYPANKKNMKSIKGGQHPARDKGAYKMMKEIADMLPLLDNPVPNTTGISYSEMLLKLITPYQQSNGSITIDELGYLLDLGLTAWNMAVYKKKDLILYEAYKLVVKNTSELDNISKRLLKKMMADKDKYFGEYNDMIIDDFVITTDDNGKDIINVISKSFVNSLEALQLGVTNEDDDDEFDDFDDDDDDEFDEFDEEDDIDEISMPIINREAVTVKPRQPFFDWLNTINYTGDKSQHENDLSIYLVTETGSLERIHDQVKYQFDKIFENELWNWEENEDKWPQNRTYKMFTEWFELSIQSTLYDLANHPLDRY